MFINTEIILKIVYLNTNYGYCTINPHSTKWRCGDFCLYERELQLLHIPLHKLAQILALQKVLREQSKVVNLSNGSFLCGFVFV